MSGSVVSSLCSSNSSRGLRIVFRSSSTCASSSVGASLWSRMYATADFPAIRPSVKEPDENLWLEAPDASPAANSPSTVVMFG